MTCFRLWLGQVILVLEAFAPDGNHWLPWAVTTTAVCTLLTFGIVSAAYYQMFATMVVSDDTTTILDLNHSYYPCDTARRCVPAGICGGVGALHSSRNHRLFGTAPRPATPAPGDNAGVAQQCVVCVRARCSLALIPNTRARRVCVCVCSHTRARVHACVQCVQVWRPGCNKVHYQPLVEVGLLVFLGCVSPWFLLLQVLCRSHEQLSH